MPALTTVAPAAAVLAHGGGEGAAADRWSGLAAYLAIGLLAAGYGRGVHELWHRRGTGAVVPVWRAVAFAAGLAVLAVGQSPAVHAAAEDSFAAHMGQHMLFLVVAGPLLAAGAAGIPFAVAAPTPIRRVAGRARLGLRWLRQPVKRAVVAGAVQTVVLVGWHLPRPYLWAVRSEPVHAAEHVCFIAASWLLWSCLLGAGRHRLSGPAALLLLFGSGMPAAGIGIALAIAPVPIYDPAALIPHGGDPLAAQQLGGLVMWAPMEGLVLAMGAGLFLRWLVTLERRLPADRALLPSGDTAPDPDEVVVR
jgi:putative membrane protein